MQHASSLFRLLADHTRLRLLHLLTQDRFNVSELTAILAMAQSTVSRHLAQLKDAGLVVEAREGGFIYYRLREETGTGSPLWTLLAAEFANAAADAAVRADLVRMQEIMRLRKEHFDASSDGRQVVPGRSWAAWARALGHLLPAMDVADIGCGEGYLTLEIARWARFVTGIDRSDDVLERAKGLGERRSVSNVAWKKGDLARLPLHDESIDLALFCQSLRYASDPERPLAEAARVLRPGGRVLILDLREHDQTWVRARFGDPRPGFADGELEARLQDAGFRGIKTSLGVRHPGNPFVVVIASGMTPHRTSVAAGPRAPSRWDRRGRDAGSASPRNRMR